MIEVSKIRKPSLDHHLLKIVETSLKRIKHDEILGLLKNDEASEQFLEMRVKEILQEVIESKIYQSLDSHSSKNISDKQEMNEKVRNVVNECIELKQEKQVNLLELSQNQQTIKRLEQEKQIQKEQIQNQLTKINEQNDNYMKVEMEKKKLQLKLDHCSRQIDSLSKLLSDKEQQVEHYIQEKKQQQLEYNEIVKQQQNGKNEANSKLSDQLEQQNLMKINIKQRDIIIEKLSEDIIKYQQSLEQQIQQNIQLQQIAKQSKEEYEFKLNHQQQTIKQSNDLQIEQSKKDFDEHAKNADQLSKQNEKLKLQFDKMKSQLDDCKQQIANQKLIIEQQKKGKEQQQQEYEQLRNEQAKQKEQQQDEINHYKLELNIKSQTISQLDIQVEQQKQKLIDSTVTHENQIQNTLDSLNQQIMQLTLDSNALKQDKQSLMNQNNNLIQKQIKIKSKLNLINYQLKSVRQQWIQLPLDEINKSVLKQKSFIEGLKQAFSDAIKLDRMQRQVKQEQNAQNLTIQIEKQKKEIQMLTKDKKQLNKQVLNDQKEIQQLLISASEKKNHNDNNNSNSKSIQATSELNNQISELNSQIQQLINQVQQHKTANEQLQSQLNAKLAEKQSFIDQIQQYQQKEQESSSRQQQDQIEHMQSLLEESKQYASQTIYQLTQQLKEMEERLFNQQRIQKINQLSSKVNSLSSSLDPISINSLLKSRSHNMNSQNTAQPTRSNSTKLTQITQQYPTDLQFLLSPSHDQHHHHSLNTSLNSAYQRDYNNSTQKQLRFQEQQYFPKPHYPHPPPLNQFNKMRRVHSLSELPEQQYSIMNNNSMYNQNENDFTPVKYLNFNLSSSSNSKPQGILKSGSSSSRPPRIHLHDNHQFKYKM